MLKEISVEITRRCPNCCVHCSSLSHSRCSESMPYETFQAVVLDAAALGASTICLSGGEPFLHSRIVDMVRFVHEQRMSCYVYTSGITMDSDGRPVALSTDQLEQLSDVVEKLIFNIEAGTEEVYNRIMGTSGCFDLLKQSVLRATGAGICAEAHFVPMALNMIEIPAVIRLCGDLGISRLSFLRLVMHGRAEQNRALLALTSAQQSELRKYLRRLQSDSALPIRVGVPLSTEDGCVRCEAATGKLNLRYDGKVFPCEVFKNHCLQKNLGKLEPDSVYQSSLKEIYYHSPYLAKVRELSEQFSDRCETCVGQYLIEAEERT